MLATLTAVRCGSCGARIARDNASSICSPCRRRDIETAASQAAGLGRDRAKAKEYFAAGGLPRVAAEFGCSPQDAFDVLVSAQVLPAMSSKRRALLRTLVGLNDLSHVAAATALGVSRWSVATYRQELGIGKLTVHPMWPKSW